MKFDFSSRFNDWSYISPSCLVDSTFCRISRPFSSTWEYYSKSKNAHGFVYQVVSSLGKPYRILSFEGPFKGGAADVSILRDTLVPHLKKNEKVMTDKGYWQESEYCWTPPTGSMNQMSGEDKVKRRKVTRIRNLNERLIGRLKFWGFFNKDLWTNNWRLHELCAQAAARLTNLELQYHPLT